MKLARFLFANLVAFTVLLLIVLVIGLWFRDPNLVNKNLPIPLPKTIVIGDVGQVLQAGTIVVKVEDIGRIAAEAVLADSHLSYRAKRGFVGTYLWLELSLSNVGEDITLDFEGEGQTVQFLLGARKPQPHIVLSLLSRDIQAITNTRIPLPSGTLTQKESWRGVVAFPVSQNMAELSLLLIPIASLIEDSSLSSFEINLPD
jgi:hypothetical protein